MIVEKPLHLPAATSNRIPVLQVTALYEDLEAGVRGQALVDCVRAGLDVPAQFKIDLWRFDWLNELSLGNMALSMARSSGLILVSASSSNPFPPEVERWFEAWVQSPGDAASSLVLLAAEHARASGSHPLRDRLQQIARRKGVDFFCELFRPAVEAEIAGAPPLARGETASPQPVNRLAWTDQRQVHPGILPRPSGGRPMTMTR
jgi:hypothetical protein